MAICAPTIRRPTGSGAPLELKGDKGFMANFPVIMKTRGAQATVTARFPINAASRAFVDAEIAKVRNCVIPICGEDRQKRPCLIGSAVLIHIEGVDVLVTAAHVLTDNADVPLFVFGSDGSAQSLIGNFVLDEKDDLATLRLSNPLSVHLSHVYRLPESMVAATGWSDDRFYGTVVGYPASSAKRPKRGFLNTPMEAYSNTGTELVGGRVSIQFDRDAGAFFSATGHGKARKPTGKSGGAIFAFRTLGMNAVWPSIPPKLVGIASRWKYKENRIEGAGPAALVRILKAAASSD